MRVRLTVMVMAVTLAAGPAFAQDADPKLEAYKKEAVRGVDEMAKIAQEMVDSVFSFGELGFQEEETSKYLTGQLEKFGFKVQRGVAGIPTAWVATWGSGKPVIALGSDIDGIPQASQKPGVAYRDPIVEGAPGHGEGHNTGVPLNIVAALAVKKIMERDKLPGTLVLWPGVAEELDGAKAWYIRDGVFKDVDVVLFTHVGNNLGVSWGDGGGTGLVSVEYTFQGETAHSAGAPWRGRSALDAVELMSAGWQYRREHLRLSQRSHHVITNGGDQPNVVPRNASIWYLPARDRSAAHQGDVGNRRQDGRGRGADDQHHLDVAHPRHRLSPAHEQAGGRDRLRQHPEGRPAAVERGGSDAGEGAAEGAGQRARRWPGDQARRDHRPGQARRQLRRRLGRHRRRVVEPAHRHPALPGQYSWPARPQLVQCHRQRHADRAQGRRRRRQGAGDDGARPADQARDHQERLGLLQQRPDQGREVRAVHQGGHAAGHSPEHRDPREVPRADEEVLLRPDEVQDLPRAAGHRVPDGAAKQEQK